ncbi:MAG: pro-sigmaK processing inhibitor BofA family protein [Clostridia bacterium]|nr:pro-sigmaK processing inhibitor BofA family protein [Clostridia bacterium]
MEYVVLVLTIIAVIIIAKVLAWPLKKIFKLMLNIALGLIMILIVNVFGQGIGLHIPFNIVTALVSGILGLPGVIALIAINYIF